MDYSKLSDYEINRRVLALKSELKPLGYDDRVDKSSAGVVDINGYYHWYDFCNNPADAWPIIQENGISVVRDYDEWVALAGVESRHGEADHFSHCYQKAPDKPLRAAMIVYLMMQEGER